MSDNRETDPADLLALTTDIVSAHVANNTVATGDVAPLIQSVHSALAGLGAPAEVVAPKQEPAVSIRASVKPDYLVCLEDGKKLTMLKRYLHTRYDMTPEDYRAKWGLPKDYPMVAPNYAETRKTLAKKIGLGRKKVAAAVETTEKTVKGAAQSITEGLASARAHLGTEEAKPARKLSAKFAKADA